MLAREDSFEKHLDWYFSQYLFKNLKGDKENKTHRWLNFDTDHIHQIILITICQFVCLCVWYGCVSTCVCVGFVLISDIIPQYCPQQNKTSRADCNLPFSSWKHTSEYQHRSTCRWKENTVFQWQHDSELSRSTPSTIPHLHWQRNIDRTCTTIAICNVRSSRYGSPESTSSSTPWLCTLVVGSSSLGSFRNLGPLRSHEFSLSVESSHDVGFSYESSPNLEYPLHPAFREHVVSSPNEERDVDFFHPLRHQGSGVPPGL